MDIVIHKVINFCYTINEIIDDEYIIIIMMNTILQTCVHEKLQGSAGHKCHSMLFLSMFKHYRWLA